MTIHPRPALALLAVAVLNLGTLHSWGFYSTWAFTAVVGSLLLGALACAVNPGPLRLCGTGKRNALPALLTIVTLLLGSIAPFAVQLLYGDNDRAWEGRAFFSANMAVMAGFTVLIGLVSSERDWVRSCFLLVAVIFGGFSLRAFTIRHSPDPVIDVYALLRDGADHVLAGANPYAEDIISPYGTARALHFGVMEPPDPRPAGYPPLPLLLAMPPRLLGLDVRWSNVAADIVASVAIFAVALRRRRPWLGVLAAAIYLNLPRAPFIIEQAWYEPMIAALFGIGFVFAELSGSWKRAGYVLLGLGLTAKQFGLPLLAPLAVAHRRQWRLIVLGLLAGGLVILPWLVWSPRDFFDIVLRKHLARPPQAHSITVGSFLLNEFGLVMPREVGWFLAAAAIAGISAITPRDSAATALGLGTALLAFCVCHTQGFPNYLYLVQYLWLLGFVALLPRPESEPADVALRPAA